MRSILFLAVYGNSRYFYLLVNMTMGKPGMFLLFLQRGINKMLKFIIGLAGLINKTSVLFLTMKSQNTGIMGRIVLLDLAEW
jgi:hypothetical protein